MVALLCFLDALKICGKLILLGEGYAVDTLKHLVLFIAAPVRACDRGQLIRLDRTGREKVRSGTEVGKVALLVEGDSLAFGKVFDKLYLVGLILFLHKRNSLVARQSEALNTKIFLYDLLHFGFKLFKNFGSEGGVNINIVVEAVIDGRTDSKLCVGIKTLHCLSKNVRGGVPKHLLAALLFKSEGFDLIVFGNLGRKIAYFAVDFGGDNLAADFASFL